MCAGGESVWGKPFSDEIKPNLTHSGESCSGRQVVAIHGSPGSWQEACGMLGSKVTFLSNQVLCKLAVGLDMVFSCPLLWSWLVCA